MTNIYPTKEEIIKFLPTLNVEPFLPAVKIWKKNNYKNWKNKPTEEKLNLLVNLIENLNYLAITEKALVTFGSAYCYYPTLQTIQLSDSKSSIISTLHEYGHHVYGDSELFACAFSTKIFMEVFPKDFTKLTWKGHLLVKK